MVNEMGCNYVTRLQEETGAHVVDIANAYAASREIFGLGDVLVTARDSTTKRQQAQYDMMFYVRQRCVACLAGCYATALVANV